jgi:transposase
VLALQALRGVAQETAATVAVEFGSFSRFERAPQAMGYTGLVASEYTSGSKKRQGAITKTGNSHLRRALVEAAGIYPASPSAESAAEAATTGAATESVRNRVDSARALAPSLLGTAQQEQTEPESPESHRRTKCGARSASPVRGSSRRMMIMKAA